MIFRELRLEGVGPYAETQVLPFSRKAGRPVTLVGGLNGAGKTTLIRSLFHVLYGARSLPELGAGRRSYSAYLSDAVNEGREHAELALELTIPGLRDGAPLTVRRQWRRAAKGAVEELDVYVDGRYDEDLSESWDETIERVAPLGIARLFFFDGEKIEALADLDAAASSLRTAVGSLLGLDLVDQLSTDLVAVQRRVLRADEQAASAELEQRQAALTAAEELAAVARQELAELEEQHARALRDHDAVLAALRAAGGDLVVQREELEAEAESTREHEADVWAEVRELAADPLAPLSLVAPLVERLAGTARRHERAAGDQRTVDVLEVRDGWVLDELARRAPAVEEELRALLAADRRERADAAGTSVPFVPSTPAATIDDVAGERLTSWRAQALQTTDRLDEAMQATDESERRISRIPSPESVRLPLAHLRESEERIEALTAQLEEQHRLATATAAQVTRAKERRDAELARLAEAQDAEERRQRVLRHAEAAKATLGQLRTRIAERHVTRIADYTLQCLGQLLRKERLIESVEIDPQTFAVTLRGRDAAVLRPGALSAGERQLTALALLWALARAAGRPLPVVIDTPLGRLDADHRRHVVERYLPAASHQVVVLSTDTEIDGPLHELLAPSVGIERRLLSDRYGRTEILDGYLAVGVR